MKRYSIFNRDYSVCYSADHTSIDSAKDTLIYAIRNFDPFAHMVEHEDEITKEKLPKTYEEGYAAGLRDAKKWKNVHEEPPERNQRVLYVPTGKERVSAGNYHGQGPRGGHYFMTANHLESAWWWMPPPELPKEDS